MGDGRTCKGGEVPKDQSTGMTRKRSRRVGTKITRQVTESL